MNTLNLTYMHSLLDKGINGDITNDDTCIILKNERRKVDVWGIAFNQIIDLSIVTIGSVITTIIG